MNKYLFGIFAIILTFAGKSFAAPLDAYYCFSTQDPQAVVAKFDSYLTSDAAKDLPTDLLILIISVFFTGRTLLLSSLSISLNLCIIQLTMV